LASEDKSNGDLEERIRNLELGQETMQRYLPRISQELLGYLLILSLPMSDRRRLELTSALLNKIKLDDATLGLILLRYFNEGKLSDFGFDDIINPLVKTFSFDRLWKVVDVEQVREIFGEMAVARWNELERYSPCKKEA
jgi:hypothetical protein